MGFIIALVIVGIVLIFAEILLIPGVGVAGILGILAIGGSCWYAFFEFGNMVGAIVTGVNVVILVLLTVYVLRAKTWKRMTLNTNIDSKAISLEDKALRVGMRGRTITRLAPMGTARFGDESVEVKALEGMIDPEVDVEIVLLEDNKVYVRPSNDEF